MIPPQGFGKQQSDCERLKQLDTSHVAGITSQLACTKCAVRPTIETMLMESNKPMPAQQHPGHTNDTSAQTSPLAFKCLEDRKMVS